MPDQAEIVQALFEYISPALKCDGDVPKFGTSEWVLLANDDPRKHAAVIRAALVGWHVDLAKRQAHMEASWAISAALAQCGYFDRPQR